MTAYPTLVPHYLPMLSFLTSLNCNPSCWQSVSHSIHCQIHIRDSPWTLVVNAEYAAYKSPKFMQPMARARQGILTGMVDRGYKIAKDPEYSWFSGFNKTPSTSSDRSSKSTRSNSSDFIAPTPSRSSILRDLSENISAGIARRRSGHEPSESKTQTAKAVKLRKGKATRLSNGRVDGLILQCKGWLMMNVI